MNVRCLQIGIWLERRHSGLLSGQGLKLEEHLAQCVDCRVQADQLDGLRRVIDSAPHAIGPHTRQRILRSALQSAGRAPQTVGRARWTAPALGVAALAFTGLAAAAVAVWPQLRSGERGAHARPAQHALQELAPPPAAEEPSSIVAPTSSEAAAPSGAVQASTAAPKPPSESGAAENGLARASTIAPRASDRPRPHAAIVHRARATGLEPDAGELLRRARAALARGEVVAADASIASALRAHPTRPQRAEAASLQAERELVAGRPAEAQTLYLAVAERYAHSDAGDNALFAAARLAQQRSDPASRPLLRRYLDQYPHGRFRAEAERRLQRLTAP